MPIHQTYYVLKGFVLGQTIDLAFGAKEGAEAAMRAITNKANNFYQEAFSLQDNLYEIIGDAKTGFVMRMIGGKTDIEKLRITEETIVFEDDKVPTTEKKRNKK
jgi:hypothetical protein